MHNYMYMSQYNAVTVQLMLMTVLHTTNFTSSPGLPRPKSQLWVQSRSGEAGNEASYTVGCIRSVLMGVYRANSCTCTLGPQDSCTVVV